MGEYVSFDLMKHDFLLSGSSYRFMIKSADVFDDVCEALEERLEGKFCLSYGREDQLGEAEIELLVHYELSSDDTVILVYLMEAGAWDIREKKPQFGPPAPRQPPPQWLMDLGKPRP